MTTFYRWGCTGAADCPKCAALEGQIYSREEWEANIMPGWHPRCNCLLEIVSTTFDQNDNRWTSEPLHLLLFNKLNYVYPDAGARFPHLVGSGKALSPWPHYITSHPNSYIGSDNVFLRVSEVTGEPRETVPWTEPDTSRNLAPRENRSPGRSARSSEDDRESSGRHYSGR